MITFSEALTQVSMSGKPSILIGNGFSRAWNSNIFDYQTLLDRADFKNRNVEIRSLFSSIGTYDFECVMRTLKAAETVLDAYGDCDELIKIVNTDQELLKEALIGAITKTHPEKPNEIKIEEYTSVRTFISKFEQIFTVNYDLLFYWARNQELPPVDYKTDDGFRDGGKWEKLETQNVHFVHGGLHIYDVDTGIEKHSFAASAIRIVDQVKNNLANGKFPLFVSEPTSEKKKRRIEHNPYLNNCFRRMLTLQGDFFILGHSFDDNDKHLFDQISRSLIKKIFVSVFGDPSTDINKRTIANALTYLGGQNRDVIFFVAESAPVWR
jgi:hypothetical protein